jgi:hypothetical protein
MLFIFMKGIEVMLEWQIQPDMLYTERQRCDV